MRKSRRMTAARRRALRKAQLASARKRKGKRAKDSLGYWVARGVKTVANKATLGVSGVLTQFGKPEKGQGRIGIGRVRIPVNIKKAKKKKK